MIGSILIIQLIILRNCHECHDQRRYGMILCLIAKTFDWVRESVKDFHLLLKSGECSEVSGSASPSNPSNQKCHPKWQQRQPRSEYHRTCEPSCCRSAVGSSRLLSCSLVTCRQFFVFSTQTLAFVSPWQSLTYC